VWLHRPALKEETPAFRGGSVRSRWDISQPHPNVQPDRLDRLVCWQLGGQKNNMTRFVLLAVGVSATAVAIAIIAGTAFFFQHHRSEKASAQTADAEFQRLRARFAGQRPLLDMRERRPIADVGASQTGARLHAFHTVIFDTRGGQRIVRITVPYRVGRLFGRSAGFRWLGELTFLDDTEFDPEPIQLSLDQVERHGPGLMVDYRRPSGGQFIAWVE
jgi:hypothetical protein